MNFAKLAKAGKRCSRLGAVQVGGVLPRAR